MNEIDTKQNTKYGSNKKLALFENINKLTN
jgi:hypothetical protein